MIPLTALGNLVASARPVPAAERCELCTTSIGDAHRHVVEIGKRGVFCACHACALLFARGEVGAKFRTVPDRVRIDASFALSPAAWTALGIPVGLAFCYRDSAHRCGVVCYPGPAGIVDAELAPEAWEAIASATVLAEMLEDDVEALLVHGEPGAPRLTAYLVPISTAFELAGRLRTTWTGLSGGDAAKQALAALFSRIDQQARHQGRQR